jgi:hypothetical protein
MENTLAIKATTTSDTISKAIDLSVCVRRAQYSWSKFSISLRPIKLVGNGEGSRDAQFLYNKDQSADDLNWWDHGYHKPMVFENLCEGKWRITYKSGTFAAIIFSEEFYIDKTKNYILCTYESRIFSQGNEKNYLSKFPLMPSQIQK